MKKRDKMKINTDTVTANDLVDQNQNCLWCGEGRLDCECAGHTAWEIALKLESIRKYCAELEQAYHSLIDQITKDPDKGVQLARILKDHYAERAEIKK